jgi:peptidyl-prolyl cis-trans isomerase SurA
VTQADIEAYYLAHPEKFKGEKKYHLRNILVATEEDAQQVVSRLDQGLSFSEAARRFSMGSNAGDGGDLGIFDMDTFNDTIKAAVKPLKKGAYSQVISTQQGFQIIYVEDILEVGGKTLEEASGEIQEILYREQGEEKFARWIDSLKKNAHVKIMM